MTTNANGSLVDTRVLTLSSQSGEILNSIPSQKSLIRFDLPGIYTSTVDVLSMTARLHSAILPNVFPNITNAFLSFAYFYNDVRQDLTVAVDDGYYDIYGLVDALNASAAAITNLTGGTPTLSSLIRFDYNPTRNRVTLIVSDFHAEPIALVFVVSLFSSQLGYTLEAPELLSGLVATATYGPSLQGLCSLFVVSPDLTTNNFSTDLTTSVIGVIPLKGDHLEMIHWENTSQNGFVVSSVTGFESMTLYLVDANNQLVDFQNYDWTISLEVSITKDGTSNTTEDTLQTSFQALLQQLQAQNAQAGFPTEQKLMTEKERLAFDELEKTISMRLYEESIETLLEKRTDAQKESQQLPAQ